MEESGIPGLYFMRARYYSADAGVFLSTDPVKHVGPGWMPSLYSYANLNPPSFGDPNGELPSFVSSFVNAVRAFVGNVVSSLAKSATPAAGQASSSGGSSSSSKSGGSAGSSIPKQSQPTLNTIATLTSGNVTSSRSSGINPSVTGYSTTTKMLITGNGSVSLQRPVGGVISSGFGLRNDPQGTTTQKHTGVDIAGKVGDAVGAAYQGKIADVGFKKEPGNFVIIDHGNGVTTRYYHMATTTVYVGQDVETGFEVGQRGNTGTKTTGSHLHFEVRTGSDINNLWNMTGGRGVPMEPPFE